MDQLIESFVRGRVASAFSLTELMAVMVILGGAGDSDRPRVSNHQTLQARRLLRKQVISTRGQTLETQQRHIIPPQTLAISASIHVLPERSAGLSGRRTPLHISTTTGLVIGHTH